MGHREEERQSRGVFGRLVKRFKTWCGGDEADWEGRRGDERISFVYGL
jgi:hypothetical protein